MNLPVIGYQTRRRDWVVANKKGIISGRSADCRYSHAVRRCDAGRGGYRVKQGDQAVFGVCRNWITENISYQRD